MTGPPADFELRLPRLLEAAGYAVELRPFGCVAVRLADHRGVVVATTDRPVDELAAHLPRELVHRVVVYSDEPSERTRERGASIGVEVLGPSTVGPALGELLLAPSPAGPPAPDLEPEPLFAAPDERTILPRIDAADVAALVAIDAERYRLRFLPHYLFAYKVRSPLAHGEPGPVEARFIAVNAVWRAAEFWEPGERTLVADDAVAGERLAPRFGEAEARAIAWEEVRRRHSVSVDHTEQHAGAIVIETRRITPDATALRVGPATLVYAPFWYAESRHGRIVLDAVTGRRSSAASGAPAGPPA